MNFKERLELFQQRKIEALVHPSVRRFFADFLAGKVTDLERGIARHQSKILLLALRDGVPLSEVLEMALTGLKGQEDVLRDFIRDLGRRDIKGPACDNLNYLILILWDGFEIWARLFRSRGKVKAGKMNVAQTRVLELEAENAWLKEQIVATSFPPLSRWNGRAAWKLVKTLMRMPGLDYQTYRQRVRRLGLDQLEPILVQKIKIGEIGPSTIAPTITFTPLGMQWLRSMKASICCPRCEATIQIRENHLLGAVTQNDQKMSHDMETVKRFNAANGSGGKITVGRASTRRG